MSSSARRSTDQASSLQKTLPAISPLNLKGAVENNGALLRFLSRSARGNEVEKSLQFAHTKNIYCSARINSRNNDGRRSLTSRVFTQHPFDAVANVCHDKSKEETIFTDRFDAPKKERIKSIGWRAFHSIPVEAIQETSFKSPRKKVSNIVKQMNDVFEQTASNRAYDFKNRMEIHVDRSIEQVQRLKRTPRFFDRNHLRPIFVSHKVSDSTAHERNQLHKVGEVTSIRNHRAASLNGTFLTEVNAQLQDEVDSGETSVDIMALLDNEKLGDLAIRFSGYNDGSLTLPQFVEVVKPFLPVAEIGEVPVVRALIKLFDDVDVNGDGTMEWEEFTTYVIDAGMNSNQNNPNGERINQYKRSISVDENRHDSNIIRMTCIDELSHLITWERHQRAVKVLQGDSLKLEGTIDWKSELHCAEYMNSLSTVVFAANNRSLVLADPFKNYAIVNSFQCSDTQLAMTWYDLPRLLYTADVKSCINVWSDLTAQRNEISPIASYPTGQDSIVDLLVLSNINLLASASLDGSIGIFDLHANRFSHVLQEKSRGIVNLAYQPEYHCIISAGYDHVARIWDPYVKSSICILRGHYNPLLGVEALRGTPQIITADEGGMVKVWGNEIKGKHKLYNLRYRFLDVRNYACIQTFNVIDRSDSIVRQLKSFTSSSKQIRAFFGADAVYPYDGMSDADKNPNVADAEPTVTALYNDHKCAFITASGPRVKVWNANSGILSNVYTIDSPRSPDIAITSICFDDSLKKLIVGDSSGEMRVLNLLNGAQMKHSDVPHSSSISSVTFAAQPAASLITSSWDKLSRLYDESITDTDETTLLKEAREHSDEITSSALSTHLSLHASGGASGDIVLWDYDANTLEAKIRAHKAEITVIHFLDPYPLLVSADSDGNICIWAVRPIVRAEQFDPCICRLINIPEHSNSELNFIATEGVKACAVMSLQFQAENQVLYTGDASGCIKVWSIAMALMRWGVKPYEPERLSGHLYDENCRGEKNSILARLESYERYRAQFPKAIHNLLHIRRNLEKRDIQVLQTWKAHEETIRCLSLVKAKHQTSRGLISTSDDRTVRVWDLRGKFLGALLQGRGNRKTDTNEHWSFFVDVESRRLEATRKAEMLLSNIRETYENCEL